jgi:hypothetical protein
VIISESFVVMIHQLVLELHSGERDDWAQIFEEHESELLS